MKKRFVVTQTFLPHIGHCAKIIDTMTRRTILVAGVDFLRRAERRAAELREARESAEAVPDHECESIVTANGHGAYCKTCGETTE